MNTTFKSILSFVSGAALFAVHSTLQAGTEIIDGFDASIMEITSPDQLNLDPSSVIIAVDAYGDEDREVNGVLFQTDRCDGCADTEGEVEKDGVTYRSTSTHFIDGWSAAPPPTFSGGTGDSAENLSLIMEDIRWSSAPSPVTIEVEGLRPNAALEIQLLFNEGADRNRRWDIGVVDGDPEDIDEAGLIFDDIQSEGISADSDLGDETFWTDENSFVATFTAKANAAGELTVVMQQHIGGQDSPGGDNNPILQAAIIHSAVPPGEPALIIEEGVVGNQAFEGALGMDFVVNLPIQVTELGAYDSESDELALPITVELWSRDDGGTPDIFDDDAGGEILASLMFEEDDGTLEGGTRFSPLDAPVVLLPGAYTIVGWGYGADEQNYNVGGRDAEAEGLTITGSEFITFVGGSRFGDPAANGEWPTSPDGGPENRYGAGNFKFGNTGDTDGDGIPDSWEDENGLNPADPADAALDGDNDGLTNLQEFERRTDPSKADTDGDGLSDGVETATGLWVDVANTGTSPTNPDTDRDGLNDGVENPDLPYDAANAATQPGTDPNKKDSDGDFVGDGSEVNGKTDPTNIADVPSVIRGGGLFTTTHIWTDGDPQLNDVFGVEEVFADPGEAEIITVEHSYIHYHDNANAPAFQDLSEPYPLWGQQGNDEGPGDRNDFAIHSVGNINITQAGEITFVCNSDDGFDLRIDGESIGEAGNRGRGNTFMPVELTAGIHELEFLHWERGGGAGVSVYIFRSTGEAPATVNDAEWQLLEASGGGKAAFQIDTVALALEAGKLTISWPSSPGENFAIETGTDLQNWEEVTDGHPASDGETTSFDFELADPQPGVLYVRVRKEG